MTRRSKKHLFSAELAEKELVGKLFGVSRKQPELKTIDEDASTNIFDLLDVEKSKRKPVWHDDADESIEMMAPAAPRKKTKQTHLRRATDGNKRSLPTEKYEERLREQFSRVKSGGPCGPKWASIAKGEKKVGMTDDYSDDEDDIDETVAELAQSTGKCIDQRIDLPKGVINVRRMNDLTLGRRRGSLPMRIVRFHPTSHVLMTANESGVIALFEVGLPNSQESFLQDVRFNDFPITSAAFSCGGTKIIAGSRRQRYLFSYGLLDGKVFQLKLPESVTESNAGHFSQSADERYIALITGNEVHVIAPSSMEYIAYFLAPEEVVSTHFLSSSSQIVFALTVSGEVLRWDLRKSGLLNSFIDNGAVRATTMRISDNDQYIACGSNTGIVNLYEMEHTFTDSAPKPIRTFDQLTTYNSYINFSGNCELMGFSSDTKDGAVRLVHMRSRSVYSNFPPPRVRIGKVTAFDFSPNCGYMATGTMNNYVNLFRLNHYKNY